MQLEGFTLAPTANMQYAGQIHLWQTHVVLDHLSFLEENTKPGLELKLSFVSLSEDVMNWTALSN